MRRMMRGSLAILLLSWLMLVLVRPVMANCTISAPTATTPMPLQLGNMTIGQDLADGTVLYRQTYNLNYNPGGGNAVGVTCSTPNPIMANYTYTQTPLPLSSWGSGQYAGKVYETGVPGIGIYVHQGVNYNAIIPVSKAAASQPGITEDGYCETGNCNVIGNYRRWDVYFVKTGPVSPGTIVGGNLPCVGVNYTNDVNSSENQVANICITGAINVIASTCKTPDITVPMGSYDVSAFTGEGSATRWIDASIKLTDCPVYYGRGGMGSWYADASGTDNSGTPVKNSISVKLTPATTVVNSSQGVFSLTHSADSAGGAGIQLAYGTGASPEFVDFGATKTYQMEPGTTGISEIPLVARYIQTGKNVTPGEANSAVTFLINYY
ncbi:fimbrial protein [Enterobacter hormaechei]